MISFNLRRERDSSNLRIVKKIKKKKRNKLFLKKLIFWETSNIDKNLINISNVSYKKLYLENFQQNFTDNNWVEERSSNNE